MEVKLLTDDLKYFEFFSKKLKMKIMSRLYQIVILLTFSIGFTGCEFLGDVFKAGVWVGIIILIAIIAVVAFIIKLFRK